MKNNILFLCTIGWLGTCSLPARAQLQFNVYSAGYFNISDYSGYTTPDGAHQFHIQYSGRQINEENWSIKARVNGPIRPLSGENISGQPFPAQKISFRFTSDDGTPPTLAQIGAGTTPIPFNAAGETVLIPRSNAPIYYQSPYDGNMQFHLYFVIEIAGGTYLDQLKNKAPYQPIVYAIPITFTLYNKDGMALGYREVNYQIQINQTLSGVPVSEPVYSIEVLGEARQGTLEFRNSGNYTEGVTATYPDGLKINAGTGYTITAKALAAAMNELSGSQATIPVSVVNLRLQPGSVPAIGGAYSDIAVSNTYQVLFNTHSGLSVPQFFNISYYTRGNDERLLNALSGSYTTTILYQLVPQ